MCNSDTVNEVIATLEKETNNSDVNEKAALTLLFSAIKLVSNA